MAKKRATKLLSRFLQVIKVKKTEKAKEKEKK